MPKPGTRSNHLKFANLLDSKFRIPSTDIRFGIDPIIGLIPGIGDWLGGAVSLYFLVYAAILEARVPVLLRMLLNILMDVVIGTIPLLGDVFDVSWKANLRNAELLEDLKRDPEETGRRSKLLVWSACIFSIALIFALLYLISRFVISLIEIIL